MQETLTSLTSSLAALSAVLVGYWLWRRQHTQCDYPPGPFSLPILGNLHNLAFSGSLSNFLSQTRQKYGDVSNSCTSMISDPQLSVRSIIQVFTIEFGGHRRIMICGYDNIHSLLLKNSDYSSNRNASSMPPLLRDVVRETPGRAEGFLHARQRFHLPFFCSHHFSMFKRTRSPSRLDLHPD